MNIKRYLELSSRYFFYLIGKIEYFGKNHKSACENVFGMI